MSWHLVDKPTSEVITRLELDPSETGAEENFRADYKRDPVTANRYRIVHLMPNTNGRDGYQSFDPPLWQLWISEVGRIVFRCPQYPTSPPIETPLTMTQEIWDAVGPAGQSVECPSCGETHSLTKGIAELRLVA